MTGSSTPTSTYQFSALSGADIVGSQRNYLAVGRVFSMPAVAPALLTVTDDDPRLSGDHRTNESSDDQSKQTADIDYNGNQVRNDIKIYAEQYFVLRGSDGKTYKLLEIELKGVSQPGNDKTDFYTFIGAVPPAGVSLTVIEVRNCGDDNIKYSDLGAGPGDVDPTFGAGTTTGTVTEKADGAAGENATTHTVTGTIAFTDNVGDSHTVLVAPQAGGYQGALTASITNSATSDGAGVVTWSFSVADSAIDYLAEGQQVTQNYTVTIKDASGDVGTKTVTIKLIGKNDGPTAVADTNAGDPVTESGVNPGNTNFAGDSSASGNALTNDTDPDLSDTKTVVGVQAGAVSGPLSSGVGSTLTGVYGTLKLNANGTWTYNLDNADTDTNKLAQGASATDTFSYTMKDSQGVKSTTTLKINITGTNDKPVVTTASGNNAGTVTEAGNLDNGTVVPGTPSISKALASTDIDTGATATWTIAGASAYGTMSITPAGVWTYTLNNSLAATQALKEGQSVNETFTATVTDQHGASASQVVTVTVKGTNDSPVAVADTNAGDPVVESGVNPGNAAFAGDSSASGNALTNDTDPDAGATKTVVGVQAGTVSGPLSSGVGSTLTGTYGTLKLNANGTWNYNLDNADTDTNKLAQGALATDTFTYTMKDDFGATSTTTLKINITGTNDKPVITTASGNNAGTVIEAGNLDNGTVVPGTPSISKALASTDIDTGATATWSISGASAYGTMSITPAGVWTYALNNSLAATQALKEGQSVNETFTATVTDQFGASATQVVTVTIKGTNDSPVAVADTNAGDPVVESGVNPGNSPFAGDPSATGNVLTNDTDPDAGATKTVVGVQAGAPAGPLSTGVGTTLTGTYGTLTLAANGTWTYALQNADTDTNKLAQGALATDTFTYTMKDDFGATSTTTLKINITGTNDKPVITTASGNDAGAVAEAGNQDNGTVVPGTPSISKALASTDIDTGATATWTISGSSAYGTMSITPAGVWTYLLNNSLPATQALKEGQSVIETFTATVTDDFGATASQVVSITINGTNDSPVAVADTNAGDPVIESGVNPGNTPDAGDPSATGNALANDTDPDAGATQTVVGVQAGAAAGPLSSGVGTLLTGTYGTLTLSAGGTWTYTLLNADADTNALAQGAAASDVFTYTMQDDFGATSTTTLTINITGTNDQPVISGSSVTTGTVTEPGDIDGIDEAGLGGGLVPTLALNSTVTDALDSLIANPGDLSSVLATITGELGDAATAIAVIWDFLDASYFYYNDPVNEAFIRLGVEYVGYLEAGGSPLIDVTAKFTADGGDAGNDPDRQQSLHDNLLGNMNTIGMLDRFGTNPPLLATLTALVNAANPDLLSREYYGGYEGDSDASARQFDLDHGYVSSASGTLVATDVDTGASLTWSGDAPGAYGDFTIDAGTGEWTYTLDPEAADPLAEGESATDSFVATVTDEHGATDTVTVTITINGTNDAPVIQGSSVTSGSINGDIAGISEAGPGGGLEPTVALNTTVTDALDSLLVSPGDLDSVLATVESELGDLPTAIAVVWDFLDDNYTYYNAPVNEAFVRLGVAYVEYLQGGGSPLVGVTAKYTIDGADDGSVPDRQQSIHDNLLGNLSSTAMGDRGFPEPLLADLTALVGTTDPDLLTRPYYGGYEGDSDVSARQFDLDNSYAQSASGDLDATDVDNGATLVWSPVDTDGAYGDFTLDANTGEWTYTEDAAAVQALGAGESAVDSFTATVTDEYGATDSITVSVTVNGVNDAPVAVDDFFSTDTATPISGNVLDDNGPGTDVDSDVDGDALTVSVLDDVDNGTLTLNPDGSFSYTPNALFVGTDTFTYQLADGNGGTDTGTVSIAVEAAAAPGQVLVLDEDGNIVYDTTTIQDAVDFAIDGQTVLVGAGAYAEQVVVDGFTDLTIRADGAVTVQAPAVLVQTATSSGGRELFGVVTVKNSTNVQIDGINVDGNGNGNAIFEGADPGQANFIGVVYRNASGGLTDVDIAGVHDAYPGGTTDDGFPVQSGNQRGVGLQVDNDSLLAFAMTGGSISDFQKNATVFNFADLAVSGVTITGGGAQTINAQNGFQALNSTGSISGNTITAIGFAGPAVAYSSAILAYDNTDLVLNGNTIEGTNDVTLDAKVVGIYVFSSAGDVSGGEISGNTISQVDSGIAVYGSITPAGIAIHDNTITDIDFTDSYGPAGVDHEPDAGLATVFTVEGSDVHDVISGGTSADALSGLAGDDVFLIVAGADHAAGETIDGGDDFDAIAFTSTTSGDALVIQPGVTNVESIYIGSYLGGGSFDTSGTEALDVDASAGDAALFSIFGNDGDNAIVGTAFGNIIYGHGGADTVTGGDGDDAIYGGDSGVTDASDADTALYATATLTASDFSYDAGSGEWTVVSTEGTDTLKGIEKVIDGAGNVFLLVDQHPAGGFGTIQAAIDAATGGETILIAPGTYSETSEYVPGDYQGLYINKPDLTLRGFSSLDGSLVTTADDARDYGPLVIAAAENMFGANHWVGFDGDGVTIQGLHLQAGPETTNKLLEVWADDVTVEGNFIDVWTDGITYTYAIAVYLNDNGTTSDEISAYSISNNILNEGILAANGVGNASDPEPAANQLIVGNSFVGTFDVNTGVDRYDAIVLNGEVAGFGWLLAPTQIPTIAGNTFADNTVPFILRGSDNDAANLPSAAQIQVILDNNGDANLTYAYVIDTGTGELVTATRNAGFGDYQSFAVTNTIDTLNLALDTTPDAVYGDQRDYIHDGDTIVVQSGAGGPVNSEIMVDNLTVKATVNSADLDLTLATLFADGSAIPGGVHDLTLADYAPGLGANVDVTGNGLANNIVGNSGNNVINGGGGDDTLKGDSGNDLLIGGSDDDVFVFGLPEANNGIVEQDVIGDWSDGNNEIHLANGITAASVTEAFGNVQITLSGDGDLILVLAATAADVNANLYIV